MRRPKKLDFSKGVRWISLSMFRRRDVWPDSSAGARSRSATSTGGEFSMKSDYNRFHRWSLNVKVNQQNNSGDITAVRHEVYSMRDAASGAVVCACDCRECAGASTTET